MENVKIHGLTESKLDSAFGVLSKHEFPQQQTDYDRILTPKQKRNMEKPCSYCKKLFKRNFRTAKEWKEAQFCSSLCEFNTKKAIKTITRNGDTGKNKLISHEKKPCLNCSMMIERRNLNNDEWQAKKYCGAHCENLHTERIKRMEKLAGKTHEDSEKKMIGQGKAKVCPVCGDVFKKEQLSAYAWRMKIYCSRDCADEMNKQRVEEKKKQSKGKICPTCKKRFYQGSKSDYVFSLKKYCSKECQVINNNASKKNGYEAGSKACLQCGKIIYQKDFSPSDWIKRKYCGLRCSNKSRAGKVYGPRETATVQERPCLNCGKKMTNKGLSPSLWDKKKYCCHDCVYDHRRKLKAEGKSFHPGKNKPNETRTYEKRETKTGVKKCLLCGEKIFEKGLTPAAFKAKKYCNEVCYHKSRVGKKIVQRTTPKVEQNPTLEIDENGAAVVYCLACNKKIEHKKDIPRYRYIKLRSCSPKCRYAISGLATSKASSIKHNIKQPEPIEDKTFINKQPAEPEQTETDKTIKTIETHVGDIVQDKIAELMPKKPLAVSMDVMTETIKSVVSEALRDQIPAPAAQPELKAFEGFEKLISDFLPVLVQKPKEIPTFKRETEPEPENLDLAGLLETGGKYMALLYPDGIHNDNILPALADLLDFLIKKQYLKKHP